MGAAYSSCSTVWNAPLKLLCDRSDIHRHAEPAIDFTGRLYGPQSLHD